MQNSAQDFPRQKHYKSVKISKKVTRERIFNPWRFSKNPFSSRVTFFHGKKNTELASGGQGFGTERARLAGDGLRTERARLAQGGYRGQGFGTERARLAQGGFLGQFYKRNPFKRNFWKSQYFAQKREGGQFSKRNPSKQIF